MDEATLMVPITCGATSLLARCWDGTTTTDLKADPAVGILGCEAVNNGFIRLGSGTTTDDKATVDLTGAADGLTPQPSC